MRSPWEQGEGRGEAASFLIEHLFTLSDLVRCNQSRDRCVLHQDCHCQMDYSRDTVQQVKDHLALCSLLPSRVKLLRMWRNGPGPTEIPSAMGCFLPLGPWLGAERRFLQGGWVCSPEWAEDRDACWTNKGS